MILEISSAAELEKHLNSAPVTLIDFWAPWCGPCKAMNPVLEQIATELKGRVSVVKINIDQAPELATQHQISSIPSLMLFSGKKQIAAQVGSQSFSQLLSWIEKNAPMPSISPGA